jgi:hypothetical protein
VDIKKLTDQMIAEGPLWTASQSQAIEPYYERARQAVVQLFPAWLRQQTPLSDSPQHVGNFTHKMLHLVGGSLKTLGLDPERQQLETYTQQVVRKAETIADAHQLVRDVDSWLMAHRDDVRVVRLADVRSARQTGQEMAAKLREMSLRVSLDEVGVARTELSEFMAKLQEVEADVMARAEQLWQARLRSADDVERLDAEVESLLSAFRNLPNDEEDFLLMRRALRLYEKIYQDLADERLTWPALGELAERCRQDAIGTFGESEPPWTPEETIGAFVDTISKRRTEASALWIASVEADAVGIASMAAADANRLHVRTSSPPSYLTPPDTARLTRTREALETRLDVLKIDWLLEKFRELSPQLRKRFLGLAASED